MKRLFARTFWLRGILNSENCWLRSAWKDDIHLRCRTFGIVGLHKTIETIEIEIFNFF